MPGQLRMETCPLRELPPLECPEGYEIRTYRPGDEEGWGQIMNTGIGSEWTADKVKRELTEKPQFDPAGLFFATKDGEVAGSACAWRGSETERESGSVHMVCVLPEHRGRGLGYWLSLAVLHYFRDHGFHKAWLSTDDFRLPAIMTYLKLGFEAMMAEEDHPGRWVEVSRKLGVEEEIKPYLDSAPADP